MNDYSFILKTKAYQYALAVRDGKILAGKYVRLACAEFIDDINRSYQDPSYRWEFRPEILEVLIEFSKMFTFPDGIKQGQPVELAPFQEFILANLFCWKDRKEGYNRYSKAYIQVSRKNAKSFLLGFISMFRALFTKYAQIFCCATKKDQAAIVMREIKKLMDSNEYIKDKFKVYSGNHFVCKITDAQLAPLSSDANTLDGLIVSPII